MNERIVKWDLIPGLVMELVNLDKEGRREFFINLPIENVPMGALMDTSSIHVDEKGASVFYTYATRIPLQPSWNSSWRYGGYNARFL